MAYFSNYGTVSAMLRAVRDAGIVVYPAIDSFGREQAAITNNGDTHLLVGKPGSGTLVEPGETVNVPLEVLEKDGIVRLAQ